jgi:hypothetical protein
MPNYYLASNRLGVLAPNGADVTETTAVGSPIRFDATYVSSAIFIPQSTTSSPVYVEGRLIGGSRTAETWFHFEYRTSSISNNIFWFQIVNSARVPVLGARADGLTWGYQFWNGSGWTNYATSPFPPVSTLSSVDIRAVAGASGSVDLYINKVLVASTSSLNAAVTNFEYFRVFGLNSGQGSWISQVVVSDSDTRDIKLTSDVADANGANNDGTGTYADTDDIPYNPLLSRVMTANGEKFTMEKAPRTFPSGYVIDSVFVNVVTRATGGVVANARAVLRIAGTDYASSNVSPALAGGYEGRSGIWNVSPATGVDFTTSEFNAMEFGLEART